MDENEMLFAMYNALANIAQERSQDVKKYLKIRKLHQEIYDSMSKYMDNNMFLHDQVLEAESQEIDLNLKDEHEYRLFIELMIYPQTPKVKSVTEVYLEKNKLRNAQKVALLKAMIDSQCLVFQIIERDEKNALVTVENFYTHEQIKISDLNLGKYNMGKDIYFCSRIIYYDGIYFQTGLSMMFKRNGTTKKWLKTNKQLSHPHWRVKDWIIVEEFYRKYGLCRYKPISVARKNHR